MKPNKPMPWKSKQRLSEEQAFVIAAERLWTPESISQTKELAQQLMSNQQQAAA